MNDESGADMQGSESSVGGEGQAPVTVRDGVLVAREPELFRTGREGFCRRLADAPARLKDVRSAHVCLASGTCRVEFEAGPGASDGEIGDRFAEAVRSAVSRAAEDGEAPPARGWTTLTLFPAGESTSCWETIRERPDELRVRNCILRKDLGLARRVARVIAEAPGILSCRATLWGRDLAIQFEPETTSAGRVMSAVEDAFRRVLRPALDRYTAEEPASPTVAKGLGRAWNIALAGGSFALTVAGLIIPGVPTVPFLLATSYYLSRSSPRLNGLLLRSRFFGPILGDLQRWGGLRRVNKIRLIGFTLVVSLVTLVVIGPPVLLLLVLLAVSSASVYAITRLPGIPSRRARASRAPSPAVA